MTDAALDHVDNLLYVCGNCHILIDRDVAAYTVDRLREIKAKHEEGVQRAVNAEFANVSFAELEELVERFASFPPAPADSSLELLRPEAKIKKNDLGLPSQHVITTGMANSATIRQFVSDLDSDDPDWSRRLKHGFVTEYLQLRKAGHRGDDLFELMCAYSARGFHKPATQCAAMSVLVYMFEACEVFER